MPDQVRVDPDAIKATSAAIRKSAGDLDQAFQKLSSTLDEHRGCWGDDDIGQGFQKNYIEAQGGEPDYLQNGKDLVSTCNDWPDGLTNAMESLLGVDQDNAAAIDQQLKDSLDQPPPAGDGSPPPGEDSGDDDSGNDAPPPPGAVSTAGKHK